MKPHHILTSLLLPLTFIAALFFGPHIGQPLRPRLTPATSQKAVQRGLNWLHSQQETTGPRAGAIGSATATCDTARVVALTGESPTGPQWTQDNISLLQRCQLDLPQILARDDAGAIAKVLRTAVATGQNPRDFGGYDLVAMLEAHYDPATGLYHPKNLFRNALALLALEETQRPIPPQAIDALIDQRNPDHCWGWPVGGDRTDTDTTGLVIAALAPYQQQAISQCVDTLKAHQLPDGGWEARWGDEESNSDSTALVITGLLAAGIDPQSPEFTPGNTNAVQALLSFQAADGAFWWKRDTPGTLLLGTNHSLPPLAVISKQ